MQHHTATPPITDAYYRVVIRRLSPAHRPALVCRGGGLTLIAVDPRSTQRQIAEWVVDNLTVDEMNRGRAAYGQPPVGDYLDDEWLEDGPFPLEVPESIRMEEA